MTYREATEYLARLRERGIRPGLSRLEAALAAAGDPHRALRVIHLAGTNGKGSTARMIQSIFTAAGYRTGLFTSPAVTGVRDTLTVDGAPVSKRAFAALVARWQARGAELTEFEYLTAMALDYFARQRVDLCVLECGMGGAGDATNVCPPPLCGVITPVALDHVAYLGDTVAAIAGEKCGILKGACPAVTSPDQDPRALEVIFRRAAERGATVYIPNAGAARLLPSAPGTTRFCYGGEEYTLPMGGRFQMGNALTALEAVETAARRGFPVGEEAKKQGLAAAFLPCRQELVSLSPLRMIDGGHNPQGVAALAETLRPVAPVTLVCGMLRDKDVAAAAALLAPLARRVICLTPPCSRGMAAEALADRFRAAGAEQVETVEDPAAAYRRGERLAGEGPLVVCGSFYTAAPIRPLMLRRRKKG